MQYPFLKTQSGVPVGSLTKQNLLPGSMRCLRKRALSTATSRFVIATRIRSLQSSQPAQTTHPTELSPLWATQPIFEMPSTHVCPLYLPPQDIGSIFGAPFQSASLVSVSRDFAGFEYRNSSMLRIRRCERVLQDQATC